MHSKPNPQNIFAKFCLLSILRTSLPIIFHLIKKIIMMCMSLNIVIECRNVSNKHHDGREREIELLSLCKAYVCLHSTTRESSEFITMDRHSIHPSFAIHSMTQQWQKTLHLSVALYKIWFKWNFFFFIILHKKKIISF